MVDLESYTWPSAGVEPDQPEDVIAEAGEQPVAGYWNHIMWAVTNDVHNVRDYAIDHHIDHEAGGSQEIDLDGLGVATVATFAREGDEFQLRYDGDPLFRLDTSADSVLAMPDFDTATTHNDGLLLGADLERTDGSVIYDHSADAFHRAEHAFTADWADEAGDAETLDGHTADEFLFPTDDATITGKWGFDQRVDADISGHARTASYAAEADHASTADHATEADHADDSDLLDGGERSLFAELADDETVTGAWTVDNDEGVALESDSKFLTYDDPRISDYLEARSVASHHLWMPHPNGQTAGDDYFGYHWDDETWLFGQDVYLYGGDEKVATEEWVENHENLGLQPDEDATITGEWTFEQTIIGDITGSASWADEAGHAEEADWAEEADVALTANYANDSDRVDGYHAHELIDEARAGGGGDGRWEFLDAWEYATGSSWKWDHSPDEYDQYRLVLVNDPSGSSTNRLWLRLNNDLRSRYYYFKHNYVNGDYFMADNRAQYFPVGLTTDGTPAYAEYIVTLPPTPTSSGAYPAISRGEFAAHPEASGGTLDYGHLETPYSSITNFSVQPQHTSAAYIALWGANLPSP